MEKKEFEYKWEKESRGKNLVVCLRIRNAGVILAKRFDFVDNEEKEIFLYGSEDYIGHFLLKSIIEVY